MQDPQPTDGTCEATGGDQASAGLTSTGITLLGVVLSIALTVGFGLKAAWWLRAAAAAAVVLALVAGIKLGTSSNAGPLARLSKWIVNAPG